MFLVFIYFAKHLRKRGCGGGNYKKSSATDGSMKLVRWPSLHLKLYPNLQSRMFCGSVPVRRQLFHTPLPPASSLLMSRISSSLASPWVFREEEEEEGRQSHTLSRLAGICQTVTLRGGAPL